MPVIDLHELLRLVASGSSVAEPTILACIGVAALFLLSELVAHRTVVYRRNNEGALITLILAAVAFYAFGYFGLLTVVVGTVVGRGLGYCQSKRRMKGSSQRETRRERRVLAASRTFRSHQVPLHA